MIGVNTLTIVGWTKRLRPVKQRITFTHGLRTASPRPKSQSRSLEPWGSRY